jgi:delta14-sterol reductase
MKLLSYLTPLIAYVVITLLHVILPGQKLKGYVRNDKTGEVLNYRLNGILVLIASILLWALLGYLKWVPLDYLYQVRWESLIGAIVMGVLFSLVIVLANPSTGKAFPVDLWFGRLKNPQCGNGYVDAKMWLYMIGAVMLQLNVLSFAAYQLQTENPNPGFLLSAALLTWFIWDYFTFEKVHVYTYDFIAERVGFKLGFGCLTFYPYFYAVGLWATAGMANPGRPVWFSVIAAIVFFAGWTFARGANMQKYYFKTAPDKKFLGIKP